MANSRSNRNAKRVQPGKKTERQGIALIGKVVADMGHLWNEPVHLRRGRPELLAARQRARNPRSLTPGH